uniref:Succinate dehydrogenase cytochrome b560 subunit, mitochondrial n=1 Tax=Tetraselmis chuii TaxID=63592 RepID=A0A7S1X2K8_9CHLO
MASGRGALRVLGRACGLFSGPPAGLASVGFLATSSAPLTAAACSGQQLMATRNLGGKWPEYFAKPSPYTEGTDFLGTPKNHQELLRKRPISPDVINTHAGAPARHYDFPITAISSVVNRVTGAGLSVGFAGVGALALVTDVPSLIEMYKVTFPFLVLPTKAVVAFPFVYHTLGGLRHLYWDHAKLGNNADKSSPLDMSNLPTSSKILMGASVVATLGVAAM